MKGVNKVIVLGRVWKDPVIRTTSNGNKVAEVGLVTSSGSGDYEKPDWHKVIFYKRQAEIVEQYLTKGTNLYVEGRINYRKYTGKDGVEKYVTEIIGSIMQMVNSPDAYKPVEHDSEHNNYKNKDEYTRAEMSSLKDSVTEQPDDVPF